MFSPTNGSMEDPHMNGSSEDPHYVFSYEMVLARIHISSGT